MNGSITIEHIEYRNIIQRDREQHNTSAQTTQRSAAQYVIDFWLIKIFVLAMEKKCFNWYITPYHPKIKKTHTISTRTEFNFIYFFLQQLCRYRGSGDRPTFKYRFGSSSTPFYTALKEQSDRGERPWQWSNMKNRYSSAQSVINSLCDEKRYEFTLTGKFEDVVGNQFNIFSRLFVCPHSRYLQSSHIWTTDNHWAIIDRKKLFRRPQNDSSSIKTFFFKIGLETNLE